MPVRHREEDQPHHALARTATKGKAANSGTRRAAGASKSGRAGRQGQSQKSGSPGLTRPVQPDRRKLAVVVGTSAPLPRTQVVN